MRTGDAILENCYNMTHWYNGHVIILVNEYVWQGLYFFLAELIAKVTKV